MANLYWDTAAESVSARPLAGHVRADLAVVGGGITGLSTALHAAESGMRVVLLEAQQPGWGASGRNGGQVNPGLKPDPDTVERDFGADLGRRMNALAGTAPALVFDLVRRHSIRCDARNNGTLRAAIGQRQTEAIRTSLEQWARRGAAVEFLDTAAAKRATGTSRYQAAMLDRRGGDLNPLSYARGLARAAQLAGAAVHGDSRVIRMSKASDGWTLGTRDATVTAGHVVLATNGYTDDLWPGLRRSVVPLFGAIAASAELPDKIAAGILPDRSVLYEIGAVTVYYRLDARQRLLIGGRGPMREVDHARAVPHLLEYARKLWPAVGEAEWTHVWGGRLAMTRDHYPHIHEPAPGVLISLGYNGRGVAMATAMGRQLARRIAMPGESFDMPLSGIQEIPLHALWPLAVKAAILKGRARDYLDR